MLSGGFPFHQFNIHKWPKRQLTIYGTFQVIKTYILPKCNYLFHSLVVPKSFLNQINSLLYYQFLWSNKPGKVKRTTLISDQEDGIIDQNLIFNKLHNKTNYLTEIHTLLQSIP